MFGRIKALLVKEFLQVFRDPRMKIVIFIAPIVQVLIFGYAATMDITNIPTAVYDLDNTKETRDIIRAFSYSQYFDIKRYIYTEKEMIDIINRSKVIAVIKFNRGFTRDLVGNRRAALQIIVDGTDSNAAMIMTGYAGQVIMSYNNQVLQERMAIYMATPNAHPVAYVDLRDRRWFNENLESRLYYLPGVIALIVTIMSLLLSAMAVVREKEIGTMEQLIVSPIKPIELILGKILPFGIIALIQVTLITLIGSLWFHLPLRGSIVLLFACTVIYLLTTLGAGLIISTHSATQQEAMMSVFLFFFPATLLSGFAYPIANMPEIIQWATVANPLRFYLVILRGIFLKGVGIVVLWDQILVLLIMGIGTIIYSATRFQKNLG